MTYSPPTPIPTPRPPRRWRWLKWTLGILLGLLLLGALIHPAQPVTSASTGVPTATVAYGPPGAQTVEPDYGANIPTPATVDPPTLDPNVWTAPPVTAVPVPERSSGHHVIVCGGIGRHLRVGVCV